MMTLKDASTDFLLLLRSLPYLRDREKVMFRCPESPSVFHPSSPNVEEYITAIQGVT